MFQRFPEYTKPLLFAQVRLLPKSTTGLPGTARTFTLRSARQGDGRASMRRLATALALLALLVVAVDGRRARQTSDSPEAVLGSNLAGRGVRVH